MSNNYVNGVSTYVSDSFKAKDTQVFNLGSISEAQEQTLL